MVIDATTEVKSPADGREKELGRHNASPDKMSI